MASTHQPESFVSLAAAARQLEAHTESAAQSHVPIAITRGDAHAIHYVNEAFARFIGSPLEQLEGLRFDNLSREPERVDALLERAWRSGVSELAPDLAYVGKDGMTLFGATLAARIGGQVEPTSIVQVVDTTVQTQNRSQSADIAHELRQGNQRLLLSSMREQALARSAAETTREVERRLRRQSVLASVNALLSSSLQLSETLQAVTGLALPDLAECCVLRLTGTPGWTGACHVDAERAARLDALGSELSRDVDVAELVARVAQTGAPCIAPALTKKAEADQLLALRASGERAGLAVPLEARGAPIGVLLFFTGDERGFAPLDVEFAAELGRRASVAIDNAQLYQEAQRASRLRENVLAIVSHDLRNPLGAITMSVARLQALLPRDERPEVFRGIQVIERASKHMHRLIAELLEVANIQAGRLTLELGEASIAELVSEALEMFEHVASASGAQLVERLEDPSLVLRCDRERIVRVIANLVGNALKFTPRGGKVQVAACRDGEHVRVDVSDAGPGIAKSEQPKLFDQYWKGAASSQAGRTGMGLGLYIARGIVDAHGGRIWVESTPPDGSTFSFCLPLVAKPPS